MFKKYLVLLLFSAIVNTSVGKPLEVIVTDTNLPFTRARLTTGYDGDDTIYLWGGHDRDRWDDEILKYSISNQTIKRVGRMADTRFGSGCWIGNNKFVHIGGSYDADGRYRKDVWNFGTSNLSNWITVTNLTYGLADSSTIWDEGVNTYTIGGTFHYPGTSDQILKYASATQTVENVGILPKAMNLPALVWDSTTDSVYIFGGHGVMDWRYDHILKFDAVNGGVTTLNVTLPREISFASAVWNGREAYIIGGTTYGLYAPPPIVRFNPTTNEVTTVPVKNFPYGLNQTAVVFVKKLNRIYIFGGYAEGRYRDEIMYIDLNESDIQDTSLPAYTWYIVIGGAVAVVIIIAMIIFCCYRKYSHRKNLQKNTVVVDQSVPLPMSPLQSYYENQNHLGVNQNSQLRGPFNPNQNFGSPATATISRAEASTVGVRDVDEPPPPYSSAIKM